MSDNATEGKELTIAFGLSEEFVAAMAADPALINTALVGLTHKLEDHLRSGVAQYASNRP